MVNFNFFNQFHLVVQIPIAHFNNLFPEGRSIPYLPGLKFQPMLRGIQRLLILLLTGLFLNTAIANEGMWLPMLLKSLNESEMQAMGLKLSAEDIYSVNESSLKDAIVHFGGFCTSEIISPQGLMLTNHHCGYGTIQEHSTLENNLLKNGFWASDLSKELPSPGLTATLIVRMEDVTGAILEGTDATQSPSERQSVIDLNINKAISSANIEDHHGVYVRPFYYGNQYFLFVTETFRDVRLVGAPPESIGKFGADTDNWIWPRHTGDFSLFRIYAGPDNLPADYSPDNKPYKPRHFLPISLDGVEEGDFNMVFGFPGYTQQYLPSYSVELVRDVLDPLKIAIRDRSLAQMDKFMRADEEVRLNYAPRFASLANSWKKWIGEVEGLKSSNAVAKRREYEKEFTSRISGNEQWQSEYGNLLPTFKSMSVEFQPYAAARDYYREVFAINIEIFRTASRLMRLAGTLENEGETAFAFQRDRLRSSLEQHFKETNQEIDRETAKALLQYKSEFLEEEFISPSLELFHGSDPAVLEELINTIYANSLASNAEKCLAALDGEPADFLEAVKSDPAVLLLAEVQAFSDGKISPTYNRISEDMQTHMQTYMRAQMEVMTERQFWPDANSTLRITYGKVNGYAPRDAVIYDHITYLEGVMEKYVPGDYEFDVHPRLIELYESKDYGEYGIDGKMPICFIGSNHTTGGNSGSPSIDAEGNLIGLNFDRVWEGTMSDLNYDPSICRNIMVDARYVLFIVDKFAGAGHLIEEMKLVHPKQK